MHFFLKIKTKQTKIWHRTFEGCKYQSLEKAVSQGTTFGGPQASDGNKYFMEKQANVFC